MEQLVGRYQIKGRLGEGAIADVYRAHDPGIGRDLAIKILKPELRQNHEITGRFLREAKAAGVLSHPNIVTIYDVGEVGGFPYIAMELLEGLPLDEVLKKYGKLELNHALRIGYQLAGGLDYAHQLGIVHRDIKPSNIMLCNNGRLVKILDFGIARVGEADPIRAEANMLRTQVGQVLGTPRYMSPEQALGVDVDKRSDLFSLGAVLYEVLTGQPAFTGDTLATIAVQIIREKPAPLSEFAASCPAGLQFIIDKLLAKKPEKRFASGQELAQALRREHSEIFSQEPARKFGPSLQLRLSLLMGIVTAAVLFLSVSAVLHRQNDAMQRMALTSTNSIAAFVSKNIALQAVDNATLPESQQDWLPVQAFATTAAQDPNVKDIVVIDARGIVRASKDVDHIGRPYQKRSSGELIESGNMQKIYRAGDGAFRVERDIAYSGKKVGSIALTIESRELVSAARASRFMLFGLALAVLLVVVGGCYGIARVLARPIKRLKSALVDAARGDLDFRISHNRKDEFGELFDRFNDLMTSLEARPAVSESSIEPASLDATRIEPARSQARPMPKAGGFGRLRA